MTTRWRGTLIYTGTLATIGTVAVTRFGPLAQTGQVPTAAPVSSSAPTASPSPSATSSPSTGATGSPSPSDPSAPATGSTTSSTVTVTGSVEQTRYGPVQVAVTFTGSQIVDVRTLQSPSDQSESLRISARSTPALAKEVLKAQSAKIDTVSGATYTSEGYRQSVQSAIDQAG